MEKLLKISELNKFILNIIKTGKIPQSIDIEGVKLNEATELFNNFKNHNIYNLELKNKQFNNFTNSPMYYKDTYIGEFIDNYFNNPAFSYACCIGYSELQNILFDQIINKMNLSNKFSYSNTGTGVFLNDLNEAVLLTLNDSIKKLKKNNNINIISNNLYDIKYALLIKEVEGKIVNINNFKYDINDFYFKINENTSMIIYEPLSENFKEEFNKILELKNKYNFTIFLNLRNSSCSYLSSKYNQNLNEISNNCDYVFTDFSKISGHWTNILFVKDKDSYASNMYIEEQKYMIMNHKDGNKLQEYNAKEYMIGFGHKSGLFSLYILLNGYKHSEIDNYLNIIIEESKNIENYLNEKSIVYYRYFNNLILMKNKSINNDIFYVNDNQYGFINIRKEINLEDFKNYFTKNFIN